MKIKIKPYLNPAMDKAMKEYKKGLFNEMAKKYAIQKRDYTFDKKAQREFMKAIAESIKPLEKALREFKKTISKIDWRKINENLSK